MKRGLASYNKKAYEKFLELFECINHGYKFNSLIGNDLSVVYQSVAKSVKDKGYNGLFVIFDEFGVFLENKTDDFGIKLNKIQSFAERCNSSDGYLLYFCCITHKDISLYQKDRVYSDDFEKISGRFKQIRFDRSLDENYQIICNAIEKKDNYLSARKIEYNLDFDFLGRIINSNIFNNINQVNYIASNGFPFNPVAMYALIQISEKIAQNERTLFTFLSDSDRYSFRYFLTNNNHGFLNIDYIYNYFLPLIRNSSESEYKKICYTVDSLSRIDLKKEHQDIFKCIALMKIINDDVKFNATESNISLALCRDSKEIKGTINELISSNLLKRNINDDSIDFNLMADSEINDLVNNTIISKIESRNICDLLTDFDLDKYIVSNKYNFEYSMTRYFQTKYLQASKLKELTDFKILFSDISSDGIVVNVFQDCSLSENEIYEIFNKHKSTYLNRVVLRINDKKISDDAINKLKRIFASKLLLEGKNTLSASVIETLKSYIDDMSEELAEYLKDYHSQSRAYCCSNRELRNTKDCIYESLISTYKKTVIFNNEQVNKDSLSAATTKARRNVIDKILGNIDVKFGTTSAEGTISDSFEASLKTSNVIIEEIQKEIITSSAKTKVAKIVDILVSSPYGMRKGIIPIFIAKAISMMTINSNNNVSTVLLYNDSQQIPVNAINITKAVASPSRFYFSYKEIDKKRITFIERLCTLFNVGITRSFNEDATNVLKAIKSYVSNLVPTIIKSSERNNILGLDMNSIFFKDLFLKRNLNTYDVLFDDLTYLSNDLERLVFMVSVIKNEYEEKMNDFYITTIDATKKMFGGMTDSIKSNYENWKLNQTNINDIIFDDEEKKIYNSFDSIMFNDFESIDMLTIAINNSTLRDWSSEKNERYYSKLQLFKDYVSCNQGNHLLKSEYNNADMNIRFSQLGNTLYSNLVDIIDEYGASITNEEKANILKKLMSNIIG